MKTFKLIEALKGYEENQVYFIKDYAVVSIEEGYITIGEDESGDIVKSFTPDWQDFED